MKKLMMTVCAMFVFSAMAKDVYVDDDNYNPDYADASAYIAAGYDGTTPEKAFGTIQDAIEASTTVANDTILVCPGIYDKGGRKLSWSGTDNAGYCRVLATKKLTIKSTEGASKTHIVGSAADSASGTPPYRCFGQYNNTTTLIDFTLRDGHTTRDDTSRDWYNRDRGGAVLTGLAGNSAPTYLVDCVVSNCVSYWGTINCGAAIRTLVCDNESAYGAAGRQATFYSCIITRNRGNEGVTYGSESSLINCTVVGNSTVYSVPSVRVGRNNIVALSCSTGSDIGGTTLANNVRGQIDGIYQTIAPALGDFRVIAGSVAATAGSSDGADGSDCYAVIPAEYRNLDFHKNPISGSGICAGALQETVATAGGALQFHGISATSQVIVNGWRSIKAGTYLFPTSYPVQYLVEAQLSTGKIYAWDTSEEHGDFHLPEWNTGAVYLMPPPSQSIVMTNTMVLAAGELWLDPEKGSDTEGDGTEEHPYETLQKGVSAGTDNTFVYCKKGTYSKGSTSGGGIGNRVHLNWAARRFVGVDGASDTFIDGASDTTTVDSQPGCGPAAMRAIYVNGTPITSFEGFTFRNCHTDAKGSGVSESAGHRGCVAYSSSANVMFSDCVIDATCSAAANAFLGCRLYRCVATNLPYAVIPAQNTSLISCVLENCRHATSWQTGRGFHCTMRNSGTLAWNYACIGADSDNIRPTSESVYFAGSIMHNFSSYYAGTTGYIRDNPLFASVAGAAVRRSSPAFTCGEIPTTSNYGAQYYKYVGTDFYGRPLTFIDGKPVAGADTLGVFEMFAHRRLAVTDATCNVTETFDGTISVPQGHALSVAAPAGTLELPGGLVLRFVVPPSGRLTVSFGDDVREFEEGEHEYRLESSSGMTLTMSSVAGTSTLCSLKKGGGFVIMYY